MDTPAAIRAPQSQPEEKGLDPDLYIAGVFCLVGILLAVCAALLFPELGTILGPFTLS